METKYDDYICNDCLIIAASQGNPYPPQKEDHHLPIDPQTNQPIYICKVCSRRFGSIKH